MKENTKDIENCYYCGIDFEFDDNESLYLGDDRLGQKKTICDECAGKKGFK
jgi:hypothetical protein